MCWIGVCKRNTAKEDITVYKYLNKKHNSPLLKYHYRKNKLCEKVFLEPKSSYKHVIDDCLYIRIHNGYHSYIEMPKEKPFYFPINSILYKFIIPKGSEYYVNTSGEVVSNQIIFTGKKAE